MARTDAKMVLFSMVFISTFAGATLVPEKFPNAVVALGSMQPVMQPGQPCVMQWATEGTRFLYGYLAQNDPDPAKRLYEVYLVTNRHVIEDHATTQAISRINPQSLQLGGACNALPAVDDSISIRMNPLSSSLQGRQFDLPIKEWFFHPNKQIDIAAFRLNAQFLKTEGLMDMFFSNDNFAANKEKIKSKGVSAGDGVFVLGFPMNLAGAQRNYVILRQGCIARIGEMLDGPSSTFLVDAFVFPGNSGSPVILRPEAISISGTPSQNVAYLFGIVRSYLPYADLAISPQTHRARITFEENSGLAEVLPIDYIDESIKVWHQTNQPRQ
jgi:hypothetical protein